jgi:hypothetical protein
VLYESGEAPGIDALPAWISTVSEVEQAHAAAVAAAAAAEAAAREAAQASQEPVWRGPRPAPHIQIDVLPPPTWCEIDPTIVDHYDPYTGEPVYVCDV